MTEDRELPVKGISGHSTRKGPEAAIFYPVPLLSGLEQLLQIQKATLEMYARQTTAAINMMQQLFPMIPAACVNAAERGVIELLRIQTGALDVIGSRIGAYPNSADGGPVRVDSMKLPEILQDSADQCLAMQRKFVEIFAQQVQSFWAAFRWPGDGSRTNQ